MAEPRASQELVSESIADHEIFEIKPVILGGSPTDPSNKVVLNRQQHIDAVRYWNRIIKGSQGRNHESR